MGPLSILLLDGNRARAHRIQDLCRVAKGEGCRVEHLDELQAASRRLEQSAPDVVLVDPVLSGDGPLMSLRTVQHQAPGIPVIVLTDREDPELAADAVKAGAQDYLVVAELNANLLFRTIRHAIERKRAEGLLREREERYALAVSGANDGLWDWHIAAGSAYFSPRWKSMLGYGDEEIEDDIEEWFSRVHPSERESLKSSLSAHLEGHTLRFEHEHRLRGKKDGYMWVLARGVALRDIYGKAYRIAGSLSDISARKRAEQQLLHDAMHDSLTALPNRALFLDRLDLALKQYRRDKERLFGVLFFDLDRFKRVNDSLGHAAGDELLICLARRLESSLRPGDTLSRLGGDEFAVLLTDVASVSDARHVAERVHELLSETVTVRGHEVRASASIGIALAAPWHHGSEDVLREADLAMYRAKSAGRGCSEVFGGQEHADEGSAGPPLEAELEQALEREEFVLYYQPVVDLEDGSITGLEALIRWRHPRFGLVGPQGFLFAAEEKDVIVPIEWWALRKACEEMNRWQMQFPMETPLTVSVNIPGKLFLQAGLTARILDLLEEVGLSASSLRLEFTEDAVLAHEDVALARLRELRSWGVRLQLDDFGTGYTSLSYLQRFSCDTFKIDRSLVGMMDRRDDGYALVRTLVMLGESFGLTVIGEGVEREEQFRQLREMRCPQAQGYWLHPPLEPAEAEMLLAETSWRAPIAHGE